MVNSTSTSYRGAARFARWLAWLLFLSGIAGTIWLAQASKARHVGEIAGLFAAESESMRSAVARQLELFFDVLASIGQLHELSDRITAEDFEEFTQKGMQFQKRVLSAYGFVQRMPHELRPALEQGDLAITELDAQGRIIPAAERPEYYPLVYQFPPDSLSFSNGLDVAMLPGFAEAIVEMRRRTGPAVVQAVRLQTPDGNFGYFILSPLYQAPGPGTVALSGFTISILWPQQILDRALSEVAPRDILVRFFDPDMTPGQPEKIPGELSVQSSLAVANRHWQFETVASPEYVSARQTILPGVILVSGITITLLLTLTLASIADRARRIEKAVAERTHELSQANRMLSEAMHERMRLESEILEISEREKQQVGQDLHDSLGQKLTGAVFLSRALATHLTNQDEETRGQAGRIIEILKDSVTQVRRMARGLSPVELGHEGLPGALQRLAEETSSVYGATCLFHQPGEPPSISSKTAHHLYAIALEAVNNAVRHGHAKEIVMELNAAGERAHLLIEDDGKGFDPGTSQRGGMGLRIMHYRATMIGGHLDISRRPSGGMQVTCSFPG